LDKVAWAKRLLSDTLFQEIWNDYETEQLNRFANSSEFDFEEREAAFKKLLVLRELKSRIESLAMQSEIDKRRWKIL